VIHNIDDSKNMTKAAPSRYVNPFADREHVLDLEERYLQEDSKRFYPDHVALSAGERIRNGRDLRGNLQKIFRWKLESFLYRFPWVRQFPDGVSDVQLRVAIEAAMDANRDEPRTILEAIRVLDDLEYVGIPVASAFLTAVYPCEFTVIDRQAYKALGVPFKDLSPEEYAYYLHFCRQQAARLKVSLRGYDRALWQRGSEMGARPACRSSRT
jgi:hypothetical protein